MTSKGPSNWRPSSAGKRDGWQIFEEHSWELAVAQCGTHQFFDEALAPIEYALHHNPLGFERVPGFDNIYIAKTKIRFIDGEITPSYRIWFRIDEATKSVAKLWIEIAPPEDMGYWDEEDEIPF